MLSLRNFTGNAIKLLAEILQQWNRQRGGLQLVSLEGAAVSLPRLGLFFCRLVGGAALNTIPRAASARVLLSSEQEVLLPPSAS